jgi:hypothetical protein
MQDPKQDPDPEQSEKSDPEKIISDPQHWIYILHRGIFDQKSLLYNCNFQVSSLKKTWKRLDPNPDFKTFWTE